MMFLQCIAPFLAQNSFRSSFFSIKKGPRRALVIEFGFEGFRPTSVACYGQRKPFPQSRQNAFPSRSRSSSGAVSGAIRQLAACARRLPHGARTGNNEASNRKRRDRSAPTTARRKTPTTNRRPSNEEGARSRHDEVSTIADRGKRVKHPTEICSRTTSKPL